MTAPGADHVPPHGFDRAEWRFWICRLCLAPRSMHPRREWVKRRPALMTRYVSKNAPHWDEGW